MAHTMEYQELLKRFDKLEARYATRDFVRAEINSVRAEINSVRTEIKASETRMIQWFIGTAIALTLAMLGIENLL